jgi:hypothetical protein
MDPPNRDLAQEEILEGIIHDAPDVEPDESPSSYVNPSEDGMEVDRCEDEANGSDDGEGDSSDDGEAGGHLTKSGEVYICSSAITSNMWKYWRDLYILSCIHIN